MGGSGSGPSRVPEPPSSATTPHPTRPGRCTVLALRPTTSRRRTLGSPTFMRSRFLDNLVLRSAAMLAPANHGACALHWHTNQGACALLRPARRMRAALCVAASLTSRARRPGRGRFLLGLSLAVLGTESGFCRSSKVAGWAVAVWPLEHAGGEVFLVRPSCSSISTHVQFFDSRVTLAPGSKQRRHPPQPDPAPQWRNWGTGVRGGRCPPAPPHCQSGAGVTREEAASCFGGFGGKFGNGSLWGYLAPYPKASYLAPQYCSYDSQTQLFLGYRRPNLSSGGGWGGGLAHCFV